MTQDNVEKQPPVPPFVRFVASAVPMVFDNSLSYYEAICAMWKYLNDTVNVINNNASITEEYIQLTKDMKVYMDNYFANLDVQEEINNKLDAMADNGTLQEIITEYIQANVAWTFDTVADMKDATNLVAGSYAHTLGFDSINDGGGAFYYITNSGVANEMDVIAVDTLYANLIIENTLNIKQLGAVTNTEITDEYKRALELSNNILIKDISGTIETYPVITIPDNTTITIINSKLYTKANATAGSSQTYRTGLLYAKDVENVKLIGNGAELYGDMASHGGTQHQWNAGVRVLNSKNVSISGFFITGHTGDGVIISEGVNTHVSNCEITDNFRNGISVTSGLHNTIEDCNLHDNGFNIAPYCGIDIEPNPDNNICDDTIIRNNTFKDNYYAILVHDPNWNDDAVLTSQIKRVTISGNTFDNQGKPGVNSAKAIYCQGVKDGHLTFSDNYCVGYRGAVQFEKNNYVDIINNVFNGSGYFLVTLEYWNHNLKISGNKFYRNANNAIYAKHLDDSIIENNDFYEMNSIGIYLTTDNDNTKHSQNNIIRNNVFHSFTASSTVSCLMGFYFYSLNNLITNNVVRFTSANLTNDINNTAGQSSGNIYSYNIMPTQASGNLNLSGSQKTLFNIIDNALVNGNLFTS